MKLDKICRTCLNEKTGLKSIFSACIPSMLMSCASVQIMQGDGLPQQICTQCIQIVNRSYSFKQLCEKSDSLLRDYLRNSLELQTVSISSEQNLMNEVKTDQLLSSSEVLQHSSIFQDIFNDATSHSLVDTFTTQNASAVVSDLAETMQSLQTIAEQCLPETWETDTQLMSCPSNSETTNCSSFNLPLNVFKCQFCGDIFKDEWSLGTHMKTHTGQSKYFCAICGNGCNTPAALNKHTLEHTLNNPQTGGAINGALSKGDNKKFECAICCKNFNEAKQLKKHLNDVHFTLTNNEEIDDKADEEIERKFACNVCGKRYKQNKLLTVHMRTHTGERPLSCEICGRTFSLPSSLLKHRNIHSGKRKYECNICGKKFNQSSNLNSHLVLHTGAKSFICAVCGKAFTTNINLDVHMRVHTGEKPFKCTSCESAFATKTQLKKHTLIHTGEKPYQCWHCAKSFRRKETRDTHVRYHTGERPYSCKLCPKKYIAANHLRVHVKTHNDDRKHQCKICLKRFVEAKTLKTHLLVHSGQKLFSCSFCERQFTQSASLNTHLKKCHC